jgi:6-phosphogluconolactonase
VKVNKRKYLIFPDVDTLSEYAVKFWIEISSDSVKKRGRFDTAISGGRTPVHFYTKLSHVKDTIPWENTHIFFADERYVPFDHEESNYRMVYQILLKCLPVPKENIHPVPIDKGTTPHEASVLYEQDMQIHFNLPCSGDTKSKRLFPVFDIIMLGIGEDGHTASLFPNAPALIEKERFAIAVQPPDKKKRKRVSITLPVINNARNIVVLACGKEKADVINEVLIKKNMDLPASRIMSKKGRVIFLLDEKSALYLKKK